jgi:dipeptidase E
MKLLLTSGGVTNPTIRRALDDMLGKPVSESTALCIPTAMYGHPWVGPGVKAWEFISGRAENPMVDLGWKSVGVLELTALPSIDDDRWKPLVLETDVLLVAGGDALYLAHWVRESGLDTLFPQLANTVWVGMSAGSMVMTPRIGREFVGWRPAGDGGADDTADDTALGLVDFSICPHFAPDGEPGNSRAAAEGWANKLDTPAYAIDDQTAISVVDGVVQVVSEGEWMPFPR